LGLDETSKETEMSPINRKPRAVPGERHKTTRELQETFAKLERIVPPPTTLKKGITNKCNVDKNIP
jgi:hypothetical protein